MVRIENSFLALWSPKTCFQICTKVFFVQAPCLRVVACLRKHQPDLWTQECLQKCVGGSHKSRPDRPPCVRCTRFRVRQNREPTSQRTGFISGQYKEPSEPLEHWRTRCGAERGTHECLGNLALTKWPASAVRHPTVISAHSASAHGRTPVARSIDTKPYERRVKILLVVSFYIFVDADNVYVTSVEGVYHLHLFCLSWNDLVNLFLRDSKTETWCTFSLNFWKCTCRLFLSALTFPRYLTPHVWSSFLSLFMGCLGWPLCASMEFPLHSACSQGTTSIRFSKPRIRIGTLPLPCNCQISCTTP